MLKYSSILGALRDLSNPDICWTHSLIITCDGELDVTTCPKRLIDDGTQIEVIDFEGLLNATPEPVAEWDDATFDGLADWIYDSINVWLEDQLDLALGEAELDEAHNAQMEQRDPIANPTNERSETLRRILANL